MNQNLIDLYIAMMRNPPTTNKPGHDLLTRVREQRLARFDKAKITRPFILPLLQQVASGQSGVNYAAILSAVANDVVTAYTPTSSNSLLVTGMISNMDAERIRIQDVLNEKAWSDFAVPARAFSGMAPALLGLNGYKDLNEPFELRPNNQLAVDIVNSATRNGQKIYACFEGTRVSQLRDTGLDKYDEFDQIAIKNIRDNLPPLNYDLQLDIPFTGAANQRIENLRTKSIGSPVLITEISTDLQNCLVEIKDSNDQAWMPIAVPVWAIAGYRKNRARPTIRFKKAYLLNGGVEIIVKVQNTADAALANDAAGSITFHGVTP